MLAFGESSSFWGVQDSKLLPKLLQFFKQPGSASKDSFWSLVQVSRGCDQGGVPSGVVSFVLYLGVLGYHRGVWSEG